MYWFGIGLELLSACLVAEVCQASRVFVMRKGPLVSRKDNTITIGVYRTATHTDRYLDFCSHHDKRHKISKAETPLYRATKLPSTSQGKNIEINHVTDDLRVDNYPSFYFQHLKAEIFQSTHAHHPNT